MKIGQPFGKNHFCGPTVLSVLSGKSTDECALLASTNGRPLKAMFINQMSLSLTKLGIKFKWERAYDTKYYNKFNRRHPYPTLRMWMESYRKPSEMDNLFLIVLTTHFILVKGDLIICSQTHGKWVPLKEYRKKAAHVHNFFKILHEVEPTQC